MRVWQSSSLGRRAQGVGVRPMIPRYLGQEPKPAGPGPARRVAELLGSNLSHLPVSRRPGDLGKLYPGRMVFPKRAVDPVSLYVISARVPKPGKVVLYAVEGPLAGGWKEYDLAEFRRNFLAVPEAESAALRNLTTITFPAGLDTTRLDILYVNSAIELAATAIATSVPPKDTADPTKKEEFSKYMSGVLTSAAAILEARDAAGAAYDTLSIGINAFGLVSVVTDGFIGYLPRILSAAVSRRPGAITQAASLTDELLSNFPLWGLYLERAFLWTQITDYKEMTSLREEAAVVEGATKKALENIQAKRDELVRLGVQVSDLNNGIAFMEDMIRYGLREMTLADQGVQKYLRRTGLSYGEIKLGAQLLYKILERNAADIKGQRMSKAHLVTLGGIGALASVMTPPAMTERAKIAAAAREYVEAGIKRLGKPPEAVSYAEVVPFIIKSIQRLFDFSMAEIRNIPKAIEALRGSAKETIPPRDALMKIKEEIKQVPKDSLLYNKLFEALRVAHTEAIRTEPLLVEHIMEVEKNFADAMGKVKAAKGAMELIEPMYQLFTHTITPQHRVYIIEFGKHENRQKFVEIMRDIQWALDISPKNMRMIIDEFVRSSAPKPLSPADVEYRVDQIAQTARNIMDDMRAQIPEGAYDFVEMVDRGFHIVGWEKSEVTGEMAHLRVEAKVGPKRMPVKLPRTLEQIVAQNITGLEAYQKTVEFLKAFETIPTVEVKKEEKVVSDVKNGVASAENLKILKDAVVETAERSGPRRAKAKSAEADPDLSESAKELSIATEVENTRAANIEAKLKTAETFREAIEQEPVKFGEEIEAYFRSRRETSNKETRLDIAAGLKKALLWTSKFFIRPLKTENLARPRSRIARFWGAYEGTRIGTAMRWFGVIIGVVAGLGLLRVIGRVIAPFFDPKADDPLTVRERSNVLGAVAILAAAGLAVALIYNQIKKRR